MMLLAACAAPGVPTMTIYEDGNRMVRLQTVPGGHDGNPFSHPASLAEEDVANVLRGLFVETRTPPFSRLLPGGGAARRPAFSPKETAFFAPLFVKGLGEATPNEMITFYETARISDRHEVTTSGGMFLQGNVMHIVLSNHAVKTEIWQDNEQYRAPVSTRPLDPIDPEPGRLVFVPEEYMAPTREGFFETLTGGKPLRVGVRFRDVPSR